MQSSTSYAMVGAAVGAVVGALALSAASYVAPTTLYTATAVRPAIYAAVPTSQTAQARSPVGAMSAENTDALEQEVLVQTQGTAVYGWAFAIFAAVAGSINAVFLMKKNRVALAASTGRREALMAGAAAVGMAAGPAFAAYGEGANVFGKTKDVEQYFTASGEGWSVVIPGKYNQSKEREVAGMVGRWEDNFDAVNNSYVVVQGGRNSVSELGNIDQVREQIVTPLLGKQAVDGPSISEGGFAPGRYSSAAILDQQEVTKDGKTYYFYELLTRTADGNEGGRHHLFSITCSNGKTYIYKAQAGDKRWFKGLERPLRSSTSSFTVA